MYFATELDPNPAKVGRYIEERRDAFGVEPICRALGVPVSTHYARRSRVPSARELEDRRLLVEIQAARSGYRRVYGARKTWKELRRREIKVGRDRWVTRLMRQEGLEVRRGKKKRTTIPDDRPLAARDPLGQRARARRAPDSHGLRRPEGGLIAHTDRGSQ